MKKNVLLSALLIALLSSCGANSTSESNSYKEGASYWTISFNSEGGSEVNSIKVDNGQKATKPENPVKAGYIFKEWTVDSYHTVTFDWNKEITADWTLFASYEVDSSSNSSSSISVSSTSSSNDEQSSSSDSQSSISSSLSQSSIGHGPDNATMVDYYLLGEGSLWGSNGWTIDGGIQLFSNPGSTDKGCILSLPFEIGDKFKVSNGTTWYGYEKIDQSSSSSNAGISCFASDSNNQNIKCTVKGTYDIYVNSYGKLWIQNSNE